MRAFCDRLVALLFALCLLSAAAGTAHAGPYEDALARFLTDSFDDTIEGINGVAVSGNRLTIEAADDSKLGAVVLTAELNAEGAAMTRAGFEYILDKHTRAAAASYPGLVGRSVSPHQLRHSCAVMMLQATRDIRKVALWLGHADVRTTEVYLRLDPSEKLEAVEAVLPPALRRGRFKAPDALIASLLDPGTSTPVSGSLS